MIARLFRIAFFLSFALLIFAGDAAAQSASIWITGPLTKVLQTNTTPGSGQSLQISASRNEFADFQVHALPGVNPIQMNVTVSDFTNSQANTTIASATNVFLYREAYLNITAQSDAYGTTGVTPDPLIPTVDPYVGQARNAFPITVPANQTQSAWIDVLVPVGAPPGAYTGTVTISDGVNQIGQLSVTINVGTFTLPSTATLKSAFGIYWEAMCVAAYGAGSDNGYSECAAYPPANGNVTTALDLIWRSEIMLGLDHRISVFGGYGGPPPGDWSQFDPYFADLIDGTAPTALRGAALTTVLYSPQSPPTVATTIQDWVAHFTANGWLATLFDYSCDGCAPSDALAREQAIHAGSPGLRTMVPTNMATATSNGLLADLNIITPLVNDMEPQGGGNLRSTYDPFLSGTNTHLWWEQTCLSHGSCSNGTPGGMTSTWPSYMIDATPVRNRVFQWLSFLDRVEAELYYHIDYCWLDLDHSCGGNPWLGVYHNGGNGDQTLIYPGTPAMIGGTTPVPVPSIRLKLVRDGMQDYEYLHALSQAGQDAFARSTAATFITNASTFNNDPQALLAARAALGNQLNQLVPAITVISSLDPSSFGQPVTFTATVTPTAGTPTGTVTLYDNGGTALGTGTLSGSTATLRTTSLAVGGHSITAVYSGDSNFATSTSAPLPQTVNAGVTLQVGPTTSLNAAGGQGGAFSPAVFQVQLSGDIGSVDYAITGVPSWLTASSTSGTVTTSPATITFTVNAAANNLAAGNYDATITFTNSDNGQGTLALSAGLGVNQSGQGGGGGGGAGAGNAGIWITGPLAKVLQTNATLGSAQSLHISASRNEFADFQVHAVPTGSPIQMNVTVSDFTNSPAGYTIASATNVFLYREAYLNITTPSDQNGTLGITPDPLIPTVDPYSHQARNAFPITVPANQTQSAWIDVLVPPGAPPGNYSGTVTLSDGGNVIGQLAVTLKVWAFTLPSTASLKSAFGVSGDPNGMCVQAFTAYASTGNIGPDNGYNECANYPGSTGPDNAIELIHRNEAMFALDHRISLSGAVYIGPPSYGYNFDWSHFDATYSDIFNGTAPTMLSGAALSTVNYTPPAMYETDPTTVQNWVSHFTANGWLGALFDYTCDEPPSTCSWPGALSKEQAIHAGSPDMKTLITTDLASATQYNLLADLNILVPIVEAMEPQGGSNQRSAYNSFLTGANKHLWWYQGCSSHGSCTNGVVGPATSAWPSYMIDATPVRNRVFQWLAFIDQIEAELYYTTDWCWGPTPVATRCASTDPWLSVYSFGGNGDGTLFYPGTPAKIGGTTPVPVPSIRLKLIRDGMQDYEYLHALSQAGQDAFARSTAATFITNAYTFNNDPQALLAAREALGNQLNQLVPATTLTSTPSSTTKVGQAYSQANTAGGGTPPYAYSVSAGTLPTGTTLFPATGTVAGIPTAPGAFSYTIKATDSTTPTASTTTQVASGTIAPAPLQLTSTASSQTQVGQSYSQTNVASGGTTPFTYSVSAGTLPPGTALNAATGTVSGTPTSAGAFSYTVLVTDSGSPAQTATQASSGTIMLAPLVPVSTASSKTQVGQVYSQTNVASGGTPPYHYAVSAGTLPAGTTLNTTTGTVSGTPTAIGAFSYSILVTDSGSPAQTATLPSSGTIVPAPLTLASTTSTITAVGQVYVQSNGASGGTTPYRYSVSAGALPAGTTLNPATGTVAGIPTKAGAWSYTILVTDSASTAQIATHTSRGAIWPLGLVAGACTPNTPPTPAQLAAGNHTKFNVCLFPLHRKPKSMELPVR